MLKAVIFDMDGVIFDSERALMSCFEEAGRKMGLKNIRSFYLDCVGAAEDTIPQKFQRRYGDGYEDFRTDSYGTYYEKYSHGRVPMKKGVKEILKYLRSNGIIIAIASSNFGSTIMEHLEGANLTSYFDMITSFDEVENGKPAPDIFQLAFKKLGFADKEGCYVIEDSYNGVRAAAAAGLDVIMVPDLLAPDAEIKGLATEIFDNLLDVEAFFKKLI